MPSLCLSARDRELKAKFREGGILQEVEWQRIPLDAGAIMVTCADGDQMPDIFNFQIRMFPREKGPRVHTLALNGGALLLPRTHLVGETNEDRILLNHIAQAREMKGIHTVVLYNHAPCGVAYANHLDLAGVLQHLVDARARVLHEMPKMDVLCFLHVDRGEREGKRTYFVSPRLWRERCEQSPVPAAATVGTLV